jgi:exodeoxyribonuclease-3
MKIISYNVNGIRAAMKKDFLGWLKNSNPDIVCIQESKAQPEQIPVLEFQEAGYKSYWYSAKKKGYSGVGIITKQEPDNIVYGMGIQKYDDEGRFIRADYGDISVVSVYHPSGSSGDLRQAFKMQWLQDFHAYVNELKKDRKKLILAGAYNICHKEIDIHDPVRNATVSGFLPEEREWIGQFNKEPHQYSWWSYRTRARERNLGWRIDYNMVAEPLKDKMKNAAILSQVVHSDHCPVFLEMDL